MMESKSTRIYKYLEEKISAGEYNPGDKLPSEAELCSEFNVSRGPVRGALDQLIAKGVIFKKKGGGSYIAEQTTPDFLQSVLPSLKFKTNDYKEALEIRLALDILSIDLCLSHHDKNDYSGLERIMTAMEHATDINDYFELDRSFHITISELSGNKHLHNFNFLAWEMIKHCAPGELYPEGRDISLIEHRKIYDAIRDNDAELAALYSSRAIKKVLIQEKNSRNPAKDTHRWNPWVYDTF